MPHTPPKALRRGKDPRDRPTRTKDATFSPKMASLSAAFALDAGPRHARLQHHTALNPKAKIILTTRPTALQEKAFSLLGVNPAPSIRPPAEHLTKYQ